MTKAEIIEKYGIEAYEKKLERARKYYQANSEKLKENNRKWKENNPEKIKEYQQEYRQTPMGRADSLVQAHKTNDKNANRGECTLTSKWIVEHIFNSTCIYCGETDWRKLGCDRIDNNLPHTPDNVVCACWDCNNERKTRPFAEFLEYKMKKAS